MTLSDPPLNNNSDGIPLTWHNVSTANYSTCSVLELCGLQSTRQVSVFDFSTVLYTSKLGIMRLEVRALAVVARCSETALNMELCQCMASSLFRGGFESNSLFTISITHPCSIDLPQRPRSQHVLQQPVSSGTDGE